jgi:hypothetical protein
MTRQAARSRPGPYIVHCEQSGRFRHSERAADAAEVRSTLVAPWHSGSKLLERDVSYQAVTILQHEPFTLSVPW